MKGIVLIFFVFFGLYQTVTESPPKVVTKAFKQKFPSAVNIKWSKEKRDNSEINFNRKEWKLSIVKKSINLWHVCFNLKEKEVLACFTQDGHWISSSMKISISELREEVKSGVKYYHPSCEIISIEMFEYVGAGTSYEIFVKCGDKEYGDIYDSNGQRIRI